MPTTKKAILTNLTALPQTLPVNPDGIPQELKSLPQWVCWRWQTRDGKWTKVPVDPKSGFNAKSNDSAYWGTFEQALSYYQGHYEVEGVGFVFTADDPYCGVDFDDTADPMAALALNSYAEWSPTGTGLHCIVKAKLTPGAKNRKGNVEVYDRGRYFAITGCCVDRAPATIHERQTEIDHLFPTDTEARSSAAPVLPDDFAPIKVSTQGDEKFRLLEAGEWQKVRRADGTQRYGSHSEADMAFCRMLAAKYNGDAEAMDRAFRASRLMREKWNRLVTRRLVRRLSGGETANRIKGRRCS
jgi:primase-polymerase (primpol)-like protein